MMDSWPTFDAIADRPDITAMAPEIATPTDGAVPAP